MDHYTISANALADDVIVGVFDPATHMGHLTRILKQVSGKDPCPLPSEQISAKR